MPFSYLGPIEQAKATRTVAFVTAAQEGRLADVQQMLQETDGVKIDDFVPMSDNRTALSAAIEFGRARVVQWLLQQGGEVYPKRVCQAYEALHGKCTSDRESIVLMLHEYRVRMREKWRTGSIPSHDPFDDPEAFVYAVRKRMEGAVKILIQRGADVNAEDNGLTPLTTAICCGHESMVRILLNAGALVDKRASPYFRGTPRDSTPLILAAHSRSELFVRLLIERGACVQAINAEGKTALMYAVERSRHQLITLLLNSGSLIDAQSNSGMTALMLSASNSNKESVDLLLEREASVDRVDNQNMTALMYAAVTRNIDIMKVLLDAGSPVNAKSHTGETALLLLVKARIYALEFRPDAIDLLLKHGASIDHVNHHGWTALMISAFKGYHQIVRTLLEQGASIEIRTETGDTALTLAHKEDHTEVVKLLLQHSELKIHSPLHDGRIIDVTSDSWGSLLQAAKTGDEETAVRLLQTKIPIDKQTPTGETALLRAVWSHQAKIVRLLIKFGANLELVDHKKWSALMKAAHTGDLEITQLLVQGGASINGFGQDGESALMRAVSQGHEDVVRVLIENGADLDAKNTSSLYWNNKGCTALMYAASGGFEGIVQLLIQAGARINPCVDYDESPLMCAARYGHEQVLAVLINNGALLNTATKARESALDIAIRYEQDATARILIDWCTNLDQRNVFGSTALICAALKGNQELVSLLLQRGAFIDAHDCRGNTALMSSARQGHAKVVRLLLQAGASMNQQDNRQYTALMHAANDGFQDCVRALLPSNDMIDHQDQFGENALLLAAKSGHEGCVLALLEAGACVDTQDNYGYSALMESCKQGKLAVVGLLLSYGALTELETFHPNFTVGRRALALAADEGHVGIVHRLIQGNALINAKGRDGQSALSLAAKSGHGRVVEALLAHGAFVDSVDEKGQTPLMHAAETEYFEVVQILLSSGANVDATDHEQFTAIMLAVLKGRAKNVALLREHGASLRIRNQEGCSTLMLAAQFGDFSVMRDLLLERSVLKDSIDYLHSGMPKQDPVMSQAQSFKPHILTEHLIELCSQMRGASEICLHVCSRLSNVEKRLKPMARIAQRGAMGAFQRILDQMRLFLVKYSSKTLVLHLVSSEQIIDKCARTHQKLDAFIHEHSLSPDCQQYDWDGRWQQQAMAYKQRIEESIQTEPNALFSDLQEPNAQKEALVLLLFESDNRESKYSEKELDLMHRIYLHVSSVTKLKIASVPDWFVPPQDVDIGHELARGSCGSAHRGRWNGAEVVIKCAFDLDEHSRDMFLLEMDIWRKLQHPNIIQLYKACHVGDPFFVCEYAENGTLSDFVYRNKSPVKTWAKLLEAARGLMYLHEQHKVVHGDLKCNNILISGTQVSGNGPAKLTDFGQSFKHPDHATPSSEEVGAIAWKAPEVISGQTRGSLASDVYSFGMCVLEAATGRLPWGSFLDAAIKYKVLRLRQLPKQPEEVDDAQWELIQWMCAWEPSERPRMGDVVEALQKQVPNADVYH